MDLLKSEFIGLFELLLVNPRSQPEIITLWAVGIVSLIALQTLIGGVFGLKLTRLPRAVPSGVIAVAVSLLALTLVRAYAVPHINGSVGQVIAQVAGVLVFTRAIALPLHCVLMKGNYVEALLAYATSLFGALLIVLAVRATWHAVVDGKASAEKQKQRKELIEQGISE